MALKPEQQKAVDLFYRLANKELTVAQSNKIFIDYIEVCSRLSKSDRKEVTNIIRTPKSIFDEPNTQK